MKWNPKKETAGASMKMFVKESNINVSVKIYMNVIYGIILSWMTLRRYSMEGQMVIKIIF